MTIKTKKEVIIEQLQKIKGIGDFQIISQTSEKALKKSRVTKVPTPSNLEEVTKLSFITVSMGNNYTEEVNKQRKDEGMSSNFKAKATYCTPLNKIDGKILGSLKSFLSKIGVNLTDKSSEVIYKHNDYDQFYIRVYPSLASHYNNVKIIFDKDGNVIENWNEVQKEYFKKPSSGSGRQGTEKAILVNNYKLESIKYLADKDGEQVINELDKDILKDLKLR